MIIIPVERKIDWRRPPVVLIALVVINILVFSFYQSNDGELFVKAFNHYEENQMQDIEWRAYEIYSQTADLSFEVDKDDELTQYHMVSDSGFARFLSEADGEHYIPKKERERWRDLRQELNDYSARISVNAYGLNSQDVSVVQLFTHQFLHGGIMHLLGNLVFLVLVGFAAEAALGSRQFLLFYLASGVSGGLLYALFANGGGSLVGASGAISGVMAMYVVLYRLKPIQFFYWGFVFTGYFRAAAIIMLPVYIGLELYGMYANQGSNVAFTAHIGGFIAGAILVYLTQKFRVNAIDEEYLEDAPKVADPTALALERVYNEMGKCEFANAWKLLKPLKKSNANKQSVVELEFNLVRAQYPAKVTDYLVHRMGRDGNSEAVVAAQINYWRRLKAPQRQELPTKKRNRLLQDALELQNFEVAQDVFASLKDSNDDNMSLAVAAQQLSVFCRRYNKPESADKYEALARELAETPVLSQTELAGVQV